MTNSVRLGLGFCLAAAMGATARAQEHQHGQPAPESAPAAPAASAAPTPPAAPVKETPRAEVDIPSEQQARMGLATVPAVRKPLSRTIRTVGIVTADERREAHVHTRINGWIEKIQADYVGKPVRKGQPLFDLYSPELLSTQEEYLVARGKGDTGQEIADVALERLKLWQVPRSQIERLEETGRAQRAVTFESPVDGIIVAKTAIQGMYITPDMELYHIADLGVIWIMITLYESDLALIKIGDAVDVRLSYDPGKSFSAKITYIDPELDAQTRTAKARIELANKGLLLKPGMFANVEMKKDLGTVLIVPEDAVIDTGVRKIVFVRVSPVRFEPREVRVGARSDGELVVLSGLEEGEAVVVSAHFLIDAESKVQAALRKGAQPSPAGHGSHKGN